MVADMNIEIYLDGADIQAMRALIHRCDGVTTNPSICRKAGITDYAAFAKDAIAASGGKPISFEVFADDLLNMERQAHIIASWGENVYVKIPITTTSVASTAPLIESLAGEGLRLNVTAILTRYQVAIAVTALNGADGIVSIFAGRIADAGHDPVNTIRYAVSRTRARGGKTKVLWASTREVYNAVQADECGCDIITMSPDLIAKLDGIGRDLNAVSLDTIKQFHRDGEGFSL